MKYNRHIVFVTPGFARDETDTACTPYLQDFFHALQQARPDWRISIVALQYPYRQNPYEWQGIQVHPLGGRNRKWAKPLIWRRTRQTLLTLHRLQSIDLIHSFWLMDATRVASKVAARLQIPHFATIMGQDAHPSNRYLRLLRLDRMKIVGLCAASVAQFHAATGRKTEAIIPWGIPENTPLPAHVMDGPTHAPEKDRPIHLLAVGSLIPIKRYDRFVRLVRLVADEFPDTQAHIIGEGPDRPALEAKAQDLGLHNILKFAGQSSREEVFAAMKKARVFVHCSESEGFGMVLMEALACGTHIVTTPVGIAAEIAQSPAAEKCALSEHTFGLATEAMNFLRHPVDWAPHTPFPISRTVADHIHLYGLDG
jgi:1,2-diacylglycerol 3-alpha-glucosyltransferase